MSFLGMAGDQWAFLIAGAFALCGGLFAVTAKRTFHSAMGLGVALLAVAFVYISMGAAFAGVIQVLVYVGGILTLLVFAVMFVAGDEADEGAEALPRWQLYTGILIAGIIAGVLAGIVMDVPEWQDAGIGQGADDMDSLVTMLFSKHVIALEVLGILLTAAMIGALVIARPLGSVDDSAHYTEVDDSLIEQGQALAVPGAPIPPPIVLPDYDVDDNPGEPGYGGEEE